MQDSNPIDLAELAREEQRRSETEQLKRDQELADIRWLMQSPQGRRFMWRLLEEAGIYRTTFDLHPNVAALNEGKRSMGLMLVNDVNYCCPHRYFEMVKEHARHG